MLLVLAIVASSALVFTDRVELLKLAVILALWAAVVAAFVSVIYRRQSDMDQAKVRDLKLVYDLQLDREISARREYELSVESQLRRELASELRAQAADEVAGAAGRAGRAAGQPGDPLRHRPSASPGARDRADHVHGAYSDWARDSETAGRVISSRIDTEDRDDTDARTDESPIIDVPEEPHPPEPEWAAPADSAAPTAGRRRRSREDRRAACRRAAATRRPPPAAATPPPPPSRRPPSAQQPSARTAAAGAADWQPAPGGRPVHPGGARARRQQLSGVSSRRQEERIPAAYARRTERRRTRAGDVGRRPPEPRARR